MNERVKISTKTISLHSHRLLHSCFIFNLQCFSPCAQESTISQVIKREAHILEYLSICLSLCIYCCVSVTVAVFVSMSLYLYPYPYLPPPPCT